MRIRIGVVVALLVGGVGNAHADTIYLPALGVDVPGESGWKVVASDDEDVLAYEDGTQVRFLKEPDATCQEPDAAEPAGCPAGTACTLGAGEDSEFALICIDVPDGSVIAMLRADRLAQTSVADAVATLVRLVGDAVTLRQRPPSNAPPIGPSGPSRPIRWWAFGRAIAEAYAFHDDGAKNVGGGGRLGTEIIFDLHPNRYAALLLGYGAILGWDNQPRFLLDVRAAAGLDVHLGRATLGALATAGTDRRGDPGFQSYLGVEGFMRLPMRKSWLSLDYQRNSHEHRAWLGFNGRGEALGFGLEWIHFGKDLGTGDDLVGVFAGFTPP